MSYTSQSVEGASLRLEGEKDAVHIKNNALKCRPKEVTDQFDAYDFQVPQPTYVSMRSRRIQKYSLR